MGCGASHLLLGLGLLSPDSLYGFFKGLAGPALSISLDGFCDAFGISLGESFSLILFGQHSASFVFEV